MSPQFSDDQLRLLGLQGWVATTTESIELPPDELGHGKGWQEIVLSAAILSQSWVTTSAPVLERLGLYLDVFADKPSCVRLLDREGRRLEVAGLDSGPEAIRRDHPDDPTSIYGDLSRGALCVGLPGGRRVVLSSSSREGGIEITPFDRKFRVEVPPPLESRPVRALIDACDDAFVRELAEERLAWNNAWGVGVAAGLVARLVETDGPRGKQWLDDFLAGNADPRLIRPRQWIRQLSPGQLSYLERLAVSEAESLGERMDELAEDLQPADGPWQRRLLELCRRRDDLEGVRLLIHEAGAGNRFDPVLFPLDKEGRLFMECLPDPGTNIIVSDERLTRARAIDPHTWWTGARTESGG